MPQFLRALKGYVLDIGCASDTIFKIPQQLACGVIGVEIDKLTIDALLWLKELKMHYLIQSRTNRTGENA